MAGRENPLDSGRMLTGDAPLWQRLEGNAAGWARRLGLSYWAGPTGEAAVAQFARMLRGTRSPTELRMALVYLAHKVSRARRVELHIEELPGKPPLCVAHWPAGTVIETAASKAKGGTSPPAAPGSIVTIPLQFEGRLRGTLRLVPSRGSIRSRTVLRRLELLGMLAAAAELRSCRLDDESAAARDPATGVYNAAYFGAFLIHSLARARRRYESLTLLGITLSGVQALRDQAENGLADATLGRAARAALGTLRVSDVVGRLDADRLVALLPGCNVQDGQRLARIVRRAVAEALLLGGPRPGPTPVVTIGVASYPDHALEPGPLLAAVEEALARARIPGFDTIATASALSVGPRSWLAQGVLGQRPCSPA